MFDLAERENESLRAGNEPTELGGRLAQSILEERQTGTGIKFVPVVDTNFGP